MYLRAIIFLLCTRTACLAQTVYLTSATNDTFLHISNKQIFLHHQPKASFTISGNMIFSGETNTRDSLLYLLKAEDIFTKKGGELISADQTKTFIRFSKGECYVPLFTGDIFYAQLKNDEHGIAIYTDDAKKPVARFSSANISQAEMCTAFSVFDIETHLRDSVLAKYNLTPSINSDGIASLQPNTPDGWQQAWEWDGTFLYPKLSSNINYKWTFDGETIKPYFMSNIAEQYAWDGRLLKPAFRINSNEEWKMENGVIEKDWKNIGDVSYQIQGQKLIPNDEWKFPPWIISGDFPPALIVFIVSGMARR